VNAARDEMKRRVAFHLDERARVMSQNEDRYVVGWIVAPPALPIRIGPRAENGSEINSGQVRICCEKWT
jgi:hypothetical protein